MPIEAFHERRRRAIIDIPEAGENTFRPGSEERLRKIHDSFLTLQPARTRFASRQNNGIGIKPCVANFAGLP